MFLYLDLFFMYKSKIDFLDFCVINYNKVKMQFFAFFFFVLSFLVVPTSASHASTVRHMLEGDREALHYYCGGNVALDYGYNAHMACEKYRAEEKAEILARNARLAQINLCLAPYGCEKGSNTTCTEEVLSECGHHSEIIYQRLCIEFHDKVVETEAMSNWFGPLKWFLDTWMRSTENHYCDVDGIYYRGRV
jgi:hypothetical protein